MGPTLDRHAKLHTELKSIADESSKLAAECTKLTAAQEGSRVLALQQRVQTLIRNEEFIKFAGDAVGSLRHSLGLLERSFGTSSSHSLVAQGCSSIAKIARSILPKPTQSYWNQVCQAAKGFLDRNFNTSNAKLEVEVQTPPIHTSTESTRKQLEMAIVRNDLEAFQNLRPEFNLKEDRDLARTIYFCARAELLTICVRHHLLDLQDPNILLYFAASLGTNLTTTTYSRSREETQRAFKVLMDAGFDPNRRIENDSPQCIGSYPLEPLIKSGGFSEIGVLSTQELFDWGVLVNPNPEDNASPYLNPNMLVGSRDMEEMSDILEMLLFNGALTSPEFEEKLKETPEGQELLLVRQEAMKEFNIINYLEPELPLTLTLLPLVSKFASELGDISRIPALRAQLLQLCNARQLERIYHRMSALHKEFSILISGLSQEQRAAFQVHFELRQKESRIFRDCCDTIINSCTQPPDHPVHGLRYLTVRINRMIQADPSCMRYHTTVMYRRELPSLLRKSFSQELESQRREKMGKHAACTAIPPTLQLQPLTDLQRRVEAFVMSTEHQSHAKKYYDSEMQDAANNLKVAGDSFQVENWLESCAAIHNGLVRELDQVFVARLLLEMNSGHLDEFSRLIETHRIQDEEALRSLFSSVCCRAPTADFLRILLLQRYRIERDTLHARDFIQGLCHSLSESLQETGRTLMETQRVFQILVFNGLDLTHGRTQDYFYAAVCETDPKMHPALLKELNQLGMR